MSFYTPDYNETFPFVRTDWPHMEFIHTWTLLNPYVPTNGSFYLCPADRGPHNFVAVRTWPRFGIRTNDLLCRNSYWYWIAFFAKGSDLWGSLDPQQRSVSEVRYPSQKIILDCEAIDPKDPRQKGRDSAGDFTLPQAHGKGRLPTGFVDGHADITWYPSWLTGVPHGTKVWQIDPSGPNGWGTGSLEWMDVP